MHKGRPGLFFRREKAQRDAMERRQRVDEFVFLHQTALIQESNDTTSTSYLFAIRIGSRIEDAVIFFGVTDSSLVIIRKGGGRFKRGV